MKKKSFQILALDGGGIKGLYSAAFLAALEEHLGITIANHFDLIAGTSTGGVIAIGLGLRIAPAHLADFYKTRGPQVFPDYFLKKVRKLFHSKYKQEPLRQALQDLYGDKLLGHSKSRLIIPTWNLENDSVRVFKTFHHSRLKQDHKLPAWKVALSTTAAPTYFPASTVIDDTRLIDGGVWANNPTMVAIIEATSVLGIDHESIQVLSIGTSSSVSKRSTDLDAGGQVQWVNAVIDIIMRAQSVSANNLAQLFLGKENVTRINPLVHEDLFDFDKLAFDKLRSQAAHDARHFAPEFEKLFAGHVADAFRPFSLEPKEAMLHGG